MGAIYLTIGVFVGGVALAALIKMLKIGDSTTFIALLLTPLIVYGVASGKVQEFTAPGGWGAKFQEVAHEAVSTAVSQLNSPREQQPRHHTTACPETRPLHQLQSIEQHRRLHARVVRRRNST